MLRSRIFEIKTVSVVLHLYYDAYYTSTYNALIFCETLDKIDILCFL